ncbi:TetR/AcrR family transcriptional regulator [Bacillus sp. ISL-40]|uniref:TetR/AcrR family transcriptional regulator n=1 Tax=unclassified Bacillus (in: firmicutes) TaxID=185979 RepID=UPI001BE5D7E3|nr:MULTISPECIES: TetR/AcrR family transcriptional regulator [unclassified Bacillus (in: firmicutes)]MBT2700310.1 TetR/AcrR family transcriptional regulator [Bacillus sp. ISL-40]MBT2742838.1 TetR/AcrR family transcriptional regulator [Bacillus sp. ISL-77]
MSKVDRRITKSQEAIKKAVIELMTEKRFDDVTIQDISDKANVNRGTIYLHYTDKFDLLDKIIEEHIDKLRETREWACEMEWVEATETFFEYFESNYLFFSTMLASKAAPSFRNKFLEFLIEAFKVEVDITKNQGLKEDVIVKFAANAYVGVLESWLKEGMPYPPKVMAKELGILLERIV